MANRSEVENRTVTMGRPDGLHLRVASEVVRICKNYKAKVSLSCRDCEEADACSILSLLMLTAGKGDSVTIRAEGTDAKEVINEIAGYFAAGAGI